MIKSGLIKFVVFLLAASVLPLQAQQGTKYWIYFVDKGPAVLAKNAVSYGNAEARLSKAAIARRAKVLGKDQVVQFSDLDLHRPYLDALVRQGIEPINTSRWLNAVSARLTAEQVATLQQASHVQKVVPVRALAPPKTTTLPPNSVKSSASDAIETSIDYGISLRQNALINVPALHDAGIFGEGVIVGMLDSGFFTSNHVAFASLDVLGEYDYVADDSVTSNQSGDVVSQHNHGTQTLSILAGYAPGSLVGPAFKSKFYLSKTEDLASERRVEEDNWMAAIEWMEAQGIDVASSSLGYRDFFDEPEENYSYSDLDGETAVVTKAAQMATEKGVVVVTSAGNEGDVFSFRYIGAPADGKDVLAVGAVTSFGERARFSSVGPTFDGRIKPDVMAMGVTVIIVSVGSGNGYRSGQGTSYACPLVAGVAAQMLSAHPDLTPLQVNEALRMTADRATAPDNEYGYGLIDARAAITYWGPAFGNQAEFVSHSDGSFELATRCLVAEDESVDKMDVYWRAKGDNVFNVAPMAQLDSVRFGSGRIAVPSQSEIEFYFSVEIPGRGRFTYPKDAPDTLLDLQEQRTTPPQAFALEQNYPNPFVVSQSATTRIQLELVDAANVTVTVYNILGREVATLLDNAALASGERMQLFWDGRSANGQLVAAGIYFYQAEFLNANGETTIVRNKMALVR